MKAPGTHDTFVRDCLLEGERAGARYLLAHPRSSPMGMNGAQLGARPGSSLEFMDHREYQPGDDLRRIDWSAYARSDRLTVKLYREEVSPHLDLLLDASRSMALAGTAKTRGLIGLAALLTSAADNASFTHRAFFTSASGREINGSHLRPAAWNINPPDDVTSPDRALASHPPTFRRRGIRVFISDLLWPGDPMSVLSGLCEAASSTVVVQLLGKADLEPPERGNLRIVDSETGEFTDLFIDAAGQALYRENLERHQALWQLACRQSGATWVTLTAEDLVKDWTPGPLMLHELLKPL
jgi:uncharacterized protein (DUF58 family)